MKLLLDQNISFRLVGKLSEDFPEMDQVRNLGLENSSDHQIWLFAKENGYTIITVDADFYELSSLFGHPPKIIWLRVGNRSTNHLAEILSNRKDVIVEFLNDSKHRSIACIQID